ncbi:MAG: aminoglycoside phosphotransferase family protein [Fimbriimonas sp.]|nr:aminoglycoside phosphotransferase family protein [Fimbriimonas sp.]
MLLEPTDDQFRALLAKHRLPEDGDLRRVTREGVTTYVRLIGDLCVRVLKDQDYASDIYTEAVAAPAAFHAGIRTPELLVFDINKDTVESEATIFRRVDGDALGPNPDPEEARAVWVQTSIEVGKMHQEISGVDDPNSWLDVPDDTDLARWLGQSADRLPVGWAKWATDFADRFSALGAAPNVFIHNDLHAQTIMVSDCRMSGIIDWGDAGWGDAALDFGHIPAEFLPESLSAYGREDHEFIGRCLREIVAADLYGFAPEHGDEDWVRQLALKHLRSLAALWESPLDASWQEWLHDPPQSG